MKKTVRATLKQKTFYFFTLLQVVVALREISVCVKKHIIIGAVWSLDEMVVVHSPGFSQAVPLVPLAEENEEAMENKSFRKLLRKLGMRAPANEQVCFLCDISLPNHFTSF